jgi:hypothetical protein
MRIIKEPAREVPVADEVDVLVAGGGPGGIAAAVVAARTGAQTMLVERYGYLGGLASGGLVLYMDRLFDQQGERCIGGVFWEMMERLRARGGLVEHTPRHLHVDSELLKVVADEMCLEAGVVLRLHSWVVDAVVSGSDVQGVIVESKSGRQALLARVCIDATGDGDVAAFAGADYDLCHMRIGLNLKIGGVDLEAFHTFRQEQPERAKAIRTEVCAAGGLPIGANPTPYSHAGVFWVNVRGLASREDVREPAPDSDVFAGTLSAVDVEDLSYAEVELRKRLIVGLDYYRRNVPGFQNVRLLAIASQLGVRDSRRIRAIHPLSLAEAQAGAKFEDTVGTIGMTLANGGHLHVPYRSLVPQEVDGLLVGGRCIGVDDGLFDPMRLIPPCMMTGQAAGTAAALAARGALSPRRLDARHLRRQLVGDGVILPA